MAYLQWPLQERLSIPLRLLPFLAIGVNKDSPNLTDWTRQVGEQPPSRVAPGIAKAAQGFHAQLAALPANAKVVVTPSAEPSGDDMALGWNAGIEQAAKVCEEWGNEKVRKWSGTELETDAKSRAWDGLQCAATIRKEKLPVTQSHALRSEAVEKSCCQSFDTCEVDCIQRLHWHDSRRERRCTCYVLPHADDCGLFVGITQSGERVFAEESAPSAIQPTVKIPPDCKAPSFRITVNGASWACDCGASNISTHCRRSTERGS